MLYTGCFPGLAYIHFKGPYIEIEFIDIHYGYPGQRMMALNGLSVGFKSGERVALIGRNGGGKSTLMLMANGILKPQQGEVRFNGHAVHYNRRSLSDLRRNVGIVFQNPEEQLFSASVLQDISLGPLNLGLTDDEARVRVMEVAEICELTPLLDRPTHALSGGEKARTALAGILAMEPLFLFADELTNTLDPWMRNQILKILTNLADQGRAVVLATHDWHLARSWSQRVIWLDKGRVYKEGATADILTGQDLPENFADHE